LAVHRDGTGTGWTDAESLDADQPHGKDYLQLNHIAKAVRKRMEQEHTSFADATVGGIHKPGGCAVLGMEITDDCTAPVVADGTYRGHGLVWAYSKDASNWGVLFCTTGAAGASTTGDWTVLKMHPDLQWSSGDVTWAGAHQFDSSVDLSKASFDASIDASHAFFDGTVIASNFEVTGAAIHDGTSEFFDEADFSAVNISGLSGVLASCTSQSTSAVDMSTVVYQVQTSGFVNANGQSGIAGNVSLAILIGDNSNPAQKPCLSGSGSNSERSACFAAVPKDWYFAVSHANITLDSIFWTGFGAGGCVSK
jgi:hypothetical protein